MPLWHRLKTLWRNLARKRLVEDDLANEIRSYQEMLEDENVRSGADPGTARREALLELGGAEQIKEAVRDVRLGVTLDAIAAELRQSLRGLRRNPSLTILGTLMLALGMGASIVVFSIFYSALLQPLPFRASDRLVEISETRLARGIDRTAFSEANFWDVRSQNRSFSEVGTYHYGEANLTGDGPAEKVTASLVSAGFFRALGVSPVVGRDFSYEEEHQGANHVAILGNRFWRSRFGGEESVIGRTLRLSDESYTVIGVLPPGEPWINDQIYLPLVHRADADRGSWEFSVVGRLAPGVGIDRARADLQRIAGVLGQAFPADDKGIGFRLYPSSRWIAADNTRTALRVLLGAVTFLLLIACLNLANLLLARGTARQREIAIRTALGAGQARLTRFVMMESLLLSGFGAALGLGLAYAALHAIRTLEINIVPRLADASINQWVLGFAVGVAIVTGLLSGIAPAMQARISGIVTALRDGDRQTGSRAQGRVRAVLVSAEVTLSFLLLVGAGLLIRSFDQLMSVHPGFQTENRLLFSVNMPGSYYEKGMGKPFVDSALEQLAALPEVVAAGAVNTRPVEGWNPGMSIDSTLRAQAGDQQAPWAGWRIVTPGYFRAAGLPLVRGRTFEASDKPVWAERGQPEPQRRVMISQQLARQIFPNQDPIGKHVILWKGQSNGDAEVIGVVGDSRERGLAAGPALTVYLPYGRNALTPEFVVHTRGNPMALLPAVRTIFNKLDANVPISDERSFEEVVERSVAPQRFNAVLLTVFGALALLLATTGIYGVLSYSMSRRTSEIGLRVALGANAASILRLTIGEGMQPALAGIALGSIGAGWLARYCTALLFGVKPFDVLTYAAVAGLLLATALIACYLPGRRAMRTDPSVALRIE